LQMGVNHFFRTAYKTPVRIALQEPIELRPSAGREAKQR
jgi:hypothetical protein